MTARWAHHPDMVIVSSSLHAFRLDCLLEAGLAAWDLDLITAAEEREAWWYIGSVASARVALPLRDSWQVEWARAWSATATGMQLVSLVRWSR